MLMGMGEAAPDALVARGGDLALARHPARRDAMLHAAARGSARRMRRRVVRSCAELTECRCSLTDPTTVQAHLV